MSAPHVVRHQECPAAVTTLRLLGGFTCDADGCDVELPFAAQRLMAFLALHGPCTRHRVAGSLWPEVNDHQALGSLRTCVWRINKGLPGLVCSEGSALTLNLGAWVDSKEQESLATSLLHHRLTALGQLLAGLPLLTTGDLLPGWYDDWVTFERERLRQLRLQALEVTVRLLLQHGEVDVALELALQAVRAEPIRETAHSALIHVYLAEGNVAEALRQYEIYRDLLEHEMGLQPSSRFTRLADRLRPARASAPPR